MYKRIRVSKTKTKDEHRLVMEAHLGRELLSTEIVHHIDGKPQNNDIANLEIMSLSEHTRHHRLGQITSNTVRRKISDALKGRKAHNRKLTNEQIVAIRGSNLTERQLASQYGVGKTTIHEIKKNNTYK